jgi:hypothetical protein
VNLHEDPQRGIRACDCSGVLLDDPPEGYHAAPMNPSWTAAVRMAGVRSTYCAAQSAAAMMPRP